MSSRHRHVIGSVSFDLELPQGVADSPEDLRQLCVDRLMAVAEEVFDEFGMDEPIQIDRLEIDLGEIPSGEQSIAVLTRRMREQLRGQLAKYRRRPTGPRAKPIHGSPRAPGARPIDPTATPLPRTAGSAPWRRRSREDWESDRLWIEVLRTSDAPGAIRRLRNDPPTLRALREYLDQLDDQRFLDLLRAMPIADASDVADLWLAHRRQAHLARSEGEDQVGRRWARVVLELLTVPRSAHGLPVVMAALGTATREPSPSPAEAVHDSQWEAMIAQSLAGGGSDELRRHWSYLVANRAHLLELGLLRAGRTPEGRRRLASQLTRREFSDAIDILSPELARWHARTFPSVLELGSETSAREELLEYAILGTLHPDVAPELAQSLEVRMGEPPPSVSGPRQTSESAEAEQRGSRFVEPQPDDWERSGHPEAETPWTGSYLTADELEAAVRSGRVAFAASRWAATLHDRPEWMRRVIAPLLDDPDVRVSMTSGFPARNLVDVIRLFDPAAASWVEGDSHVDDPGLDRLDRDLYTRIFERIARRTPVDEDHAAQQVIRSGSADGSVTSAESAETARLESVIIETALGGPIRPFLEAWPSIRDRHALPSRELLLRLLTRPGVRRHLASRLPQEVYLEVVALVHVETAELLQAALGWSAFVQALPGESRASERQLREFVLGFLAFEHGPPWSPAALIRSVLWRISSESGVQLEDLLEQILSRTEQSERSPVQQMITDALGEIRVDVALESTLSARPGYEERRAAHAPLTNAPDLDALIDGLRRHGHSARARYDLASDLPRDRFRRFVDSLASGWSAIVVETHEAIERLHGSGPLARREPAWTTDDFRRRLVADTLGYFVAEGAARFRPDAHLRWVAEVLDLEAGLTPGTTLARFDGDPTMRPSPGPVGADAAEPRASAPDLDGAELFARVRRHVLLGEPMPRSSIRLFVTDHRRQLSRLLAEFRLSQAELERATAIADHLDLVWTGLLGITGSDPDSDLARATHQWAEASSNPSQYYRTLIGRLAAGSLVELPPLTDTVSAPTDAESAPTSDPTAQQPGAGGDPASAPGEAVLSYLESGEAPSLAIEAVRVGLRTLLTEPQHPLRGRLLRALESSDAISRAISLLDDSELVRVIHWLRPGDRTDLEVVGDLLEGASYDPESGSSVSEQRRRRREFELRYFVAERRPYDVRTFAPGLVDTLLSGSSAGQPDRAVLAQRVAAAVLDETRTSVTRVLDALRSAPEDAANPLLRTALPTASTRTPTFGTAELVPGTRLPVARAGIVLLTPFLPRLFEALGLLDSEGAFGDEADVDTATLALRYLSTGESEHTHEAVIENVLCGRDPDAGISTLALEPDQKDLADSLLEAALEHWSALGKTSPDTLRRTFLDRGGHLVDEGEQLRLEIDHGPYDMLIDRIPWGFRTVRFPWMPRLLQVSWRDE